MDKFRSRKFCIILYPLEDVTHKKAIEYIKLNYDYALIDHNKDLDTDGNLKKQHTHVVLSFPNAKWNTAIADELGIQLNYIQKCRSFDNALEYLIHYNDNDKYQYSIDEVQGNLKTKLNKILLNDDKDENQKAYELIDYIDNFDGIIEESDFFKYTCEIGMYDVVRRSAFVFIRIIDKHNQRFLNSNIKR